MPNSPADKKYWAFISYSSKDKKWGQWLHRRLENYPIPKEFQGSELFDGATLGKNLRPIFRDRDELAGSSDLGPAILKGLKESRFLIVLCSPNSAQSEWVDKEIVDFRALAPGNEKNILALILDGEPNATSNPKFDDKLDCFPPALRYPAEPLAGDLRKEGDGKERGFLKVLSGIAQLDFDTLYRRHERAQQKKRLILGVASLVIIGLLTGLTFFALSQKKEALTQKGAAVEARDEAKQELAGALLFQSQAAIANEQFHDALPPLIRASDLFVELGNTPPELARLLQLAVDGNHLLRDFKPHSDRVNVASFCPDGSVLLTMSSFSQEVALWNTTTWKPILSARLKNLRQAVFSRESNSFITLQEDEDESTRLAQAIWKRWSLEDGKLLDSKVLDGWSLDDFSLEEGDYTSLYPVTNLYSRADGGQHILRLHSIESNKLDAEIPLPDSSRFAKVICFPESETLLVCDDEKVAVLNYPSGKSICNLQDVSGFLHNVFVSKDHRKLFARNHEGTDSWGIWDLQTGERQHKGTNQLKLYSDLEGALMAGDLEDSIATLNENGFPTIPIRIPSWKTMRPGEISASLASGIIAHSGSNEVHIDRPSTGIRFSIPTHQRDIAHLTFHPGTNRLVTFDEIGQAQVHEVFDQTFEDAPALKDIQVASLEINPVVGRGLYRTAGNELIIWDAATEQLVCTMLGANDQKNFSHDWHPATHRLVTRSADKVDFNDPDPPTLRVYDTTTGQQLLELPETWPRQIAPDGSSLLTFKDDTFTLHPLGRPGQPIILPDPSTDDSQSSAAHGISPDGKTVALAASQGRVVLHSSNNGKLLREFDIPHNADKGLDQHSFSKIIFNPSGTKLLVTSNLESSYLIDLSTEEVTRAKDLQFNHGHDYEFQQDGRLLICPSYDEVELWSFPDLKLTTTIRSGADHLFLYPEESLFLAWNDYDDCLLGSLETGIETHTYSSPIAVNSEHGLIATHDDSTLNILDFRTNKVLRSTPADSADDGLFSPDGRTLYFVDDDNTLRKFTFHQDLPTLLQRARLESPPAAD